MVSLYFHRKENEGTVWFPVRNVHPGLVTSDNGVQEFGVTVFGLQHVLGLRIRPGNPIVPSFSLQRKSDESTKHYLSQMLLAIN